MLLTWQKQFALVTSIFAALTVSIGCGGNKSGNDSVPNATVVEKNGYVEIARRNVGTGGRTLVNAINVPAEVLSPPASRTVVSASVSVKVVSYSASGTEPNARIRGFFYNDGTAGGAPGSALGDIVGGVMVTNSRVYYVVSRCGDASCTSGTQLMTADLGSVSLNEQHTLSTGWDMAAKRFLFKLDNNTVVSVDPTNVAPVAKFPANKPTVGFGIRIDASAGQVGEMTAQFDNFTFNETLLYDDFADSTLDSAKWTMATIN